MSTTEAIGQLCQSVSIIMLWLYVSNHRNRLAKLEQPEPTLTIYKLAYRQRMRLTDADGIHQETINIEGEGRMVGDSAEDAMTRYLILNPNCHISTVQLEHPPLHSGTGNHCTREGKRYPKAGVTPGPHPH